MGCLLKIQDRAEEWMREQLQGCESHREWLSFLLTEIAMGKTEERTRHETIFCTPARLKANALLIASKAIQINGQPADVFTKGAAGSVGPDLGDDITGTARKAYDSRNQNSRPLTLTNSGDSDNSKSRLNEDAKPLTRKRAAEMKATSEAEETAERKRAKVAITSSILDDLTQQDGMVAKEIPTKDVRQKGAFDDNALKTPGTGLSGIRQLRVPAMKFAQFYNECANEDNKLSASEGVDHVAPAISSASVAPGASKKQSYHWMFETQSVVNKNKGIGSTALNEDVREEHFVSQAGHAELPRDDISGTEPKDVQRVKSKLASLAAKLANNVRPGNLDGELEQAATMFKETTTTAKTVVTEMLNAASKPENLASADKLRSRDSALGWHSILPVNTAAQSANADQKGARDLDAPLVGPFGIAKPMAGFKGTLLTEKNDPSSKTPLTTTQSELSEDMELCTQETLTLSGRMGPKEDTSSSVLKSGKKNEEAKLRVRTGTAVNPESQKENDKPTLSSGKPLAAGNRKEELGKTVSVITLPPAVPLEVGAAALDSFALSMQKKASATLFETTTAVAATIVDENGELPEISSDYSDEDEGSDSATSEAPAPKKEDTPSKKKALAKPPVPQWVETPNLIKALEVQNRRDPDGVFGGVKPLQLEKIFPNGRVRKKFRDSCAGNWTGTDVLTAEEEEVYKQMMGYL